MNGTDTRHLPRMRRKVESMLESVGAPPQRHPEGGPNDLRAIDHMLDALASALGIELGADLLTPDDPEAEPWRAELHELLANNKKLHAVKLYREKMGGSLRETVDVIEEMLRNM